MTEKVRHLKTRIKPIFNEPDQPEPEEQSRGTGPLIRHYIDELDMDLYVPRATEKKEFPSSILSVRLPGDVTKDINIMLASGKTQFRDRSEFIRTAVHILLHYYAHRLKGGLLDSVTLRETKMSIEKSRDRLDTMNMIISSFREHIVQYIKVGEEALHIFIEDVSKKVENDPNIYVRDHLKKKLSQILEDQGINPAIYFTEDEKE